MNGHSPRALLLALLCLLLLTPFAYGATILTDAELDTFGAGGIVLGHAADESQPEQLSDKELVQLTGAGIPGFIWPFQYVPLKRPVKTVTVNSPNGDTWDMVIFRGVNGLNSPSLPGGSDSPNAFPLSR